MPDALELPGMLRAVVPLVSGERLPSFRRSVVGEFIAVSFRGALRRLGFAWGSARLCPGFAAIVGALDDLAEPAAGLRGVDAVRIHVRSLEVINLPAGEVRPADVPLFAFSIGGEHKGSLVCADQDSNFAHSLFSFSF